MYDMVLLALAAAAAGRWKVARWGGVAATFTWYLLCKELSSVGMEKSRWHSLWRKKGASKAEAESVEEFNYCVEVAKH